MPPRRNKITTKTKRVDTTRRRQITERHQAKFRLMEISLKIDDHIYKNVLISAKTAQAYLEEISALIGHADGDVHYFQVAEKLISLMTKIIAEETERADNITTQNTSIGLKSVVDKEHFLAAVDSQEKDHSPVHTSICLNKEQIQYKQNINTVELLDDEPTATAAVDTIQMANTNLVEVIDLTDDMKTLSVDDGNICFNSQEYSQSTLTDFQPGLLNDGQGSEEYNKYNFVTNTPIPQYVTQSGCLNDQTNQSKNKKADIKTKRRSASKKAVKKCCDMKNNNVKNSTKRRKPICVKAIKAYASKTNVSSDKGNCSSNAALTDKVKPTNDDTNNLVKKPIITSSKASIERMKNTDSKFNPPIQSQVVQPKVARNTVNNENNPTTMAASHIDLSWVENIKFIREIHREEYSPLDGLAEAFWNNCEFPPDWDDGYFSYP